MIIVREDSEVVIIYPEILNTYVFQWTIFQPGAAPLGKKLVYPPIKPSWWLSLPLWKMMEFVSWDYEIPNHQLVL